MARISEILAVEIETCYSSFNVSTLDTKSDPMFVVIVNYDRHSLKCKQTYLLWDYKYTHEFNFMGFLA